MNHRLFLPALHVFLVFLVLSPPASAQQIDDFAVVSLPEEGGLRLAIVGSAESGFARVTSASGSVGPEPGTAGGEVRLLLTGIIDPPQVSEFFTEIEMFDFGPHLDYRDQSPLGGQLGYLKGVVELLTDNGQPLGNREFDSRFRIERVMATVAGDVVFRLHGHRPLAITNLTVLPPTPPHTRYGQLYAEAVLSSDGEHMSTFSFSDVEPGKYIVRVRHYFGSYPYEYITAAQLVEVLPAPVCVPSQTVLCLADDRFAVEATYEDFEGAGGSARAVTETDNAGFFWFFDDSNLELFVKVLDACELEFETFWVFASATTDVGVDLTVTDTQTGVVWSSSNPVGQTFEPILDTEAFATCEPPLAPP